MHKQAYSSVHHWLTLGIGLSLLAGCQSTPAPSQPSVVTTVIKEPALPPALVIEETRQPKKEAKVKAVPNYGDGKIQRQSLPSSVPPSPPPQPKVLLRDGSNIPAFSGLISRAQQQIQANQLVAAEQTLIQAQRMAPQSTAVYAYLSQVALKKGQGSNAEAMARKGLMLTTNPRQQHAFWQLILASAELQNNATLAGQARSQMQRLAEQF